MSNVPKLHTVPTTEAVVDKGIDLWQWPKDFPANIAIINRPLPKVQFWTFAAHEVRLLPAPSVSFTELWDVYWDEPVMGWHQLQWFLMNQNKIPASWQEFVIYFLGFKFVRKPWVPYLYGLKYLRPSPKVRRGRWESFEERFDNRPASGKGKIILSR